MPDDPRLYINTVTCCVHILKFRAHLLRKYSQNAPFSAVVCGVQGSGKSHTVACLLESMFIPQFPSIGSLEKPLSGLVLHFGEGGPSSQPCEASWIGVPSCDGFEPPVVRVFVSRSSLKTMRKVYSALGSRVVVKPLIFTEEELDAEAFLTMMAVDSSESVPLYVHVILVSECAIIISDSLNHKFVRFTVYPP